MKKPRKSCLRTSIVILIALFLTGSILFSIILLVVPQRAEQIYGPASVDLTGFERLTYSLILLVQEDALVRPEKPFGTEISFKIEAGESTPSVIGRLWEQGLISNPGAFRTYLRYSGLDTSLQAGTYTLNPSMSPIQLAQVLQDATSSEVSFLLLSGWRMEEIAAALPTSGLRFTPETFLQAAKSIPPGYSFSGEISTAGSVEGFLLPDSYLFEREISAEEFIRRLLDNFEENLTPKLRERFAQQNLSVLEAVTLASIIQREAVAQEEMPLIASVFYNRLAIGMTLDTDPTVQYAVGYNDQQNTWWTNPLSLEDLQVDSPYNTYLYPGLPPGPISNPSLTAIRAVAFPAQTPYYYFRASCDGSGRHSFAETYQEHQLNACP
jgi:UPF0755 protein